MPNEKINFLIDSKERKAKIIYVKDKDLVGFDTSNIFVISLYLYKLKKFGLSENFILMEDDYFIGKPLKKSELFYEENGKVHPYLIGNEYMPLDKNRLLEIRSKLFKNVKDNDVIMSNIPNGFNYIMYSSRLFLYDIFGEDIKRNGFPLIEAAFTHNTLPIDCTSIKEIHDYIKERYEYANLTLNSTFRNIRSICIKVIYPPYAKNKYDRRVNIIDHEFQDISSSSKITNNKSSLFVINESGGKVYPQIVYKNLINRLQFLFPMHIPFEIAEENKKNYNNSQNLKIYENKSLIDIIKKENKLNFTINRNKTKKENISKIVVHEALTKYIFIIFLFFICLKYSLIFINIIKNCGL